MIKLLSMRVTLRISGRWLQSKHFLNNVEFDSVMLFVLDCNQFEIYENDTLLNSYKLSDVEDKIQWEDDIEYSWMEKRGKPVPLEKFKVQYTSGTGGSMEFAFDIHSDFDLSKLKFSRVITNCKLPCCSSTKSVSLLEPAIGYEGKTIFTWQNLESQNVLENSNFTTNVVVEYKPSLRGKYSTPINTAAGMIFADPERTILSGFTKKLSENLIIPEGVVQISEGCFDGCEKVKSVIIPETVTSIKENAFTNCENLTEILFLSDIKLDFSYNFLNWSNLNKIAFQKTSNYKCKSDFLLSIDGKTLYKILGKRKICFLPNGIEKISETAFCDSSIIYLQIPNSVQECLATDFGSSLTRMDISETLLSKMDTKFFTKYNKVIINRKEEN